MKFKEGSEATKDNKEKKQVSSPILKIVSPNPIPGSPHRCMCKSALVYHQQSSDLAHRGIDLNSRLMKNEYLTE